MVMGKRTDEVYLWPNSSFLIKSSSVSSFSFVLSSVSLLTWNNRLGHPSFKTFRKILSSMNVSFSLLNFINFLVIHAILIKVISFLFLCHLFHLRLHLKLFILMYGPHPFYLLMSSSIMSSSLITLLNMSSSTHSKTNMMFTLSLSLSNP